MQARLIYQEPFITENYAKLIFNCNELPKDTEHTNAYFRRFLTINFDVTIPEDKQDKELHTKIIDNELSGVFNWVLEGLDSILTNNEFTKCEAIDNARLDYEKTTDSVMLFVEEMDYKKSIDNYTSVKTLYDEYKIFCFDDGFRPVNKHNFRNGFRIISF
jgi:putative DNA primase/helicase